jgi:hypothetical protein
MDLYAAGKIKPYVSERFPLAKAGDAIAHLASRKAMGKVVVVNEELSSRKCERFWARHAPNVTFQSLERLLVATSGRTPIIVRRAKVFGEHDPCGVRTLNGKSIFSGDFKVKRR